MDSQCTAKDLLWLDSIAESLLKSGDRATEDTDSVTDTNVCSTSIEHCATADCRRRARSDCLYW